MASHVSAKKRIRQTARRLEINKRVRSRLRSLEKTLRQFVKDKNKEQAVKELKIFHIEIDRSVKKSIHHKNRANRKKSQLSILVNRL